MSLTNTSHHLPNSRSPWCRLLATKTSIPSGPSRSWKRISSEFWQRTAKQRFHMTFGISPSEPRVTMKNDHSNIPNICRGAYWWYQDCLINSLIKTSLRGLNWILKDFQKPSRLITLRYCWWFRTRFTSWDPWMPRHTAIFSLDRRRLEWIILP